MIQPLHNSTRLGFLKIKRVRPLDGLTRSSDWLYASSLDNLLIFRANTFYGNNYLSSLQNVYTMCSCLARPILNSSRNKQITTVQIWQQSTNIETQVKGSPSQRKIVFAHFLVSTVHETQWLFTSHWGTKFLHRAKQKIVDCRVRPSNISLSCSFDVCVVALYNHFSLLNMVSITIREHCN